MSMAFGVAVSSHARILWGTKVTADRTECGMEALCPFGKTGEMDVTEIFILSV